MRIVRVMGCGSVQYGSMERYLVCMAEAARQRGHEMAIGYNSRPRSAAFVRDLERAGAELAILDLPDAIAPRHLPRLAQFLRRACGERTREPAVIHAYFTPSCHYTMALSRVMGVHRRYRTSANMPLTVREALAARGGSAFTVSREPRAASRLFARRQRLLARLPQCVICLSRAMRDEFFQLGVEADRLVVIRGGVDCRHFVPANAVGRSRVRAELGVGAEHRLIGTLARLVPIKGVGDLIRAAPIVLAQHPHARFVVIGDGPLARGLQSLASELGIADRCLFTGRCADVRDVLAALDTVVLPSLSEGMSNALMEAMATARPVVATDIPANAELVRDGENGLLVPPRCPEGLAHALCQLLSDPDRAAAMGAAGRRLVEEELNVYRRVQEELRLYETGEN